MVNDILSAVAFCLYEEFGSEYKFYKENIVQGFKNPSFLISCIGPTCERYMGKRYYRKNRICIQYFPLDENFNSENFAVMERLFSCLEYLNFENGVVAGSGMSTQQIDGVLSFNVDYNFFVTAVTQLEMMEHLDSSQFLSSEFDMWE